MDLSAHFKLSSNNLQSSWYFCTILINTHASTVITLDFFKSSWILALWPWDRQSKLTEHSTNLVHTFRNVSAHYKSRKVLRNCYMPWIHNYQLYVTGNHKKPLLVNILLSLFKSSLRSGSAQTVQSPPAEQHFIECSQSLSDKHPLCMAPTLLLELHAVGAINGHIPAFVGSEVNLGPIN